MRIHAVHKLPRAGRHESFGYGTLTEIPWPPVLDVLYAPPPEGLRPEYMILGNALQDVSTGAGLALDLYKSIETGWTKATHQHEPVVAERFYVLRKKQLLPYMVRYRLTQSRSQTLLYLENLELLHREWTACPLVIQDPLCSYVDAVVESDHTYPPHISQLWDQLHTHRAPHFSVQELHGVEVTRRLDTILLRHTTARSAFAGARPLPEDSLTRCKPNGTFTVAELGAHCERSPLPLTPPPALEETLGGGDLQTPLVFAETAALLDRLVLTDLDLKYILLQGVPQSPEVRVAYDRFAHLVPALTDQRILCARIATTAYQNLQTYLQQHPEHPLCEVDDLTLRLIRTFNDEAWLHFRPHRESATGPGLSVHIDLALLGLCAPGASVT